MAQLRTGIDPARNLAELAGVLRAAAESGADFVATPEGTNLLQRNRDALLAALKTPEEDVVVQGVRALAKELSLWVLIGSALVLRPDGKPANRCFVIDDKGEIRATYDKIHMFDVNLGEEVHRESETYTPGAKAVTVDTPWGKMGLSICYDLRFPHLYHALAKAGAELIFVPSAFTTVTGAAHWATLLRARAIETGTFIAAPAQGGTHEDGRQTWGRSMMISPWGELIAYADNDEPGVLGVAIDLNFSKEVRSRIPALENARAFVGP